MRDTTNYPFELVIIESGTEYFKDQADVFVPRPSAGSTLVRDLNAGIDHADGDILVHTANDIFTRPGWLEALIECFEIPDCGVATLAASDLNQRPMNKIMEGIYGPLMAFKCGWEFDPDYKNIFSDSDLIMRIYEAGFRSYRNWRVRITHLYQQTYSVNETEEDLNSNFEAGKRLFIEKHKDSNLFMYRVFTEGVVI